MIEAKSAGEAIMSIAQVLLEHGVVDDHGCSVLQRAGTALKGKKQASDWDFEISVGEPVTFSEVTSGSGTSIRPRIMARIAVDQTHQSKPPFTSLDIALEIDDAMANLVSRWHIDLANSTADGWQDGPLIHLQYGGYSRHKDLQVHTLNEPRWCHPPMEVVLLCELVAANFYREKWIQFRETPNWAGAIKLYEGLCYSNYLSLLGKHVGVSGAPSALHAMWAGNWS